MKTSGFLAFCGLRAVHARVTFQLRAQAAAATGILADDERIGKRSYDRCQPVTVSGLTMASADSVQGAGEALALLFHLRAAEPKETFDATGRARNSWRRCPRPIRFAGAFPTSSPPTRRTRAALAKDLSALGASRVETFAAGRHHAVLAAFGPSPRVLVNAHVDTVPANSGYTSPPLELTERGGRLYGLGSADKKGAIAAALEAIADRSAAGRPVENTAFLFSGDEERGNTVLRFFLESGRARGIERVVVCEPTGCRVGVRHRGIGAARGVASSPGGHSSRADAIPAPIATLARAAVAIHDWGREKRAEGPRGFVGLCVNVAAIDGGVAFNVVPTRATLTVSFRPWPGADVLALHRDVEERARGAAAPDPIDWEIAIASAPFASRDVDAFAPLLGERTGAPVDLQFWTEAALFSAAGIDAVVFGPGEIAQARAADDFVHTAQLEEARDVFIRGLP